MLFKPFRVIEKLPSVDDLSPTFKPSQNLDTAHFFPAQSHAAFQNICLGLVVNTTWVCF